MESKHTKGPWVAFLEDGGATEVRSEETGYTVGTFNGGAEHSDEEEANAARIVACVNALEGYRPEMVREAIEMLQSIVKSCPETLRALRIDAAKTVALLEEK